MIKLPKCDKYLKVALDKNLSPYSLQVAVVFLYHTFAADVGSFTLTGLISPVSNQLSFCIYHMRGCKYDTTT